MMRATLVFMSLFSLAGATSAAPTIFINDVAGFNATVAIAALTFVGTEDWESSTLAANNITTVVGPIAPGVANGVFPTGTNVATGLTVQENSGAGMPTNTTSPGNLATASAGFLGTPTDQVSTNAVGVSFDMIFSLSNTTAISFTPLVFDQAASGNAGTANIRIFDSSNNLLLVHSVNVAGFTNPATFVGIVSAFGEDIGRINVFATSTNDEFSGADNIDVYTGVIPDPNANPNPTPEPTTLALIAVGLASLCSKRLSPHIEAT